MRVLLLGASGQLGTECAHLLSAQATQYDVLALSRQQLDFANQLALTEQLQTYQPHVVINACAYTAVDKAEQDSKAAQQVNADSVAVLAKTCREIDAVLIHISTDYVFDGESPMPYEEDTPVNPLSVYGQTKHAGEEYIMALLPRHIILRTSWVFGSHGNNFVKTMLRLASTHTALNVVDDQVGRPTYAKHIAQVIMVFLERILKAEDISWGVYHCSSHGSVSWYEFAQAIFNRAHDVGIIDSIPAVQPIPSTEYPTPAHRPKNSVLNTRKLEAFLGHEMPSWQSGLSDMLANNSSSSE